MLRSVLDSDQVVQQTSVGTQRGPNSELMNGFSTMSMMQRTGSICRVFQASSEIARLNALPRDNGSQVLCYLPLWSFLEAFIRTRLGQANGLECEKLEELLRTRQYFPEYDTHSASTGEGRAHRQGCESLKCSHLGGMFPSAAFPAREMQDGGTARHSCLEWELQDPYPL